MKTIRISAAQQNGEKLPPAAELHVLRAEIKHLQELPSGADVPFGRDSVASREVLLGAYRRREAELVSGLQEAGEEDLDVRLEVEDGSDVAKKSFSVGIVQLGPDGEPVASREDLSAAALADAIRKAEMGSPALKRIKEIIQEANLTPKEAEEFMTTIAQLAAMYRYAHMPTEEYHKKANEARLERLSRAGFITPHSVDEVSKVQFRRNGEGVVMPVKPSPGKVKGESKLERKMRRKR